MNKSYLLDNEGMRTRTDIPNWVAKEFENFSNVILEPTFPCYFGVTALKKNELRYSFLSHNDWSHLPNTMLSFLELMKERPVVRRGFFFLWNRNVRNNQSNIIVITFGKYYNIYMKMMIKRGRSKFRKTQITTYGNFHLAGNRYLHLEMHQLINNEKLGI